MLCCFSTHSSKFFVELRYSICVDSFTHSFKQKHYLLKKNSKIPVLVLKSLKSRGRVARTNRLDKNVEQTKLLC